MLVCGAKNGTRVSWNAGMDSQRDASIASDWNITRVVGHPAARR